MPYKLNRLRWLKLSITVAMLMLIGFVVQMAQPPKASALLKEIVSPIIHVGTPEQAASESSDIKEQGTGLLDLSLPALTIETPIVQVETPQVAIQVKDSIGVTAEVSPIGISTPVLNVETSGKKIAVDAQDNLLPNIKVEAPAIKAKTPLLAASIPSVKAIVGSGNDRLPEVELELPDISVRLPVVKPSVPPVGLDKENDDAVETVPVPPLVESADPLPEKPIEPVIVTPSQDKIASDDETNGQRDLESTGPRVPNQDKPDTAVKESGSNKGSVNINETKASSSRYDRAAAPVTRPPLTLPLAVPANAVVTVSPAVAGSNASAAGGPAVNSWSAPWMILTMLNVNAPRGSAWRVSSLYLIENDQWSQAPPEQPPMYASFSQTLNLTFN
ncbi:hypothetical protein [Paenibacillus paridis]|uniref:hypothetical protein n=1 Tax=Paenibacillus paridis TaxID=2583376 RepID=UPI00111EE525|nr:hypothetical protein [Paenibacillus paridis]